MRRWLPLVLVLCPGCGRRDEDRPPPAASVAAPSPLPGFETVWSHEHVRHEPAALGLFVRDGWVYVAGGHDESGRGRVSKVRAADGTVAWSIKGETYQPSYPVSNGRVVVHGEFYSGFTVGLDDTTGAPLWKAPTGQSMAAACFSGDLVFCGSYSQEMYGLYAIDWATGEIRWKTPLGEAVRATPAVHGDHVLVGCYDGILSALEVATGKVTWSLDCGGRIASSLVVARDLALLAVDAQRVTDAYDSAKAEKDLVVVDLKVREERARFRTKSHWDPKIVAAGDHVFFFDATTLYAFDVPRAALAYEIERPPVLMPLVFGDDLVLALRPRPMDCTRPTGSKPDPVPIVIYDRKTGAKVASSEDGGRHADRTHYVQVEDVVVVAGGPAFGYRFSR